MYLFMTSIGAPPVVSKQKLLDQKFSFQRDSRSGNSSPAYALTIVSKVA